MKDHSISSTETQHPRAVKFGRVVFILVGSILFGVACWFSYKNPDSQVFLAAAVMGIGMVLIWLGFVLPPKAVAYLGFWLPGLLPGE